MSSLTTTTINTANGTTNLTVTTGNTSGPAIVVTSGTNIALRANATANVLIANSLGTNFSANATFTANGNFVNTYANNYNGNTVSVVTATANVHNGNTVSVVNAAISSNTLTLGTASISTTGYSRLPNGLLLQWGSVSTTSTAGDITFPAAFGTIYSFSALPVGAYNSTYATQCTALSTTAASVRTANTTARTVYWQALGV